MLKPELDTIHEPRGYLATIGHGLVVDHVRRRELERAYLEAIAHLPEPEAPSPEVRLLLLETLARIDALLDGLTPKARTAFLLSRLEGLSYPEIAERLGVSLSSVEKYMAAAVRHCYLNRCSVSLGGFRGKQRERIGFRPPARRYSPARPRSGHCLAREAPIRHCGCGHAVRL
jgi:RNA polymerase sigma factor (sigma-70 family)